MVIILQINSIFSSIRWKIVLTYLVIIAVAFSFVNISVTRVLEKFLVDQRIKAQQKIVDNLAIQTAPYLESSDAEILLQIVTKSQQGLNGRILILNYDGVVQVDGFSELNGTRLAYREVQDIVSGIKDSSYGYHHLDKPLSTPESATKSTAFQYKNQTKKMWVVYYTSVITYNTQRIGLLMLSVPVQDVMDQIGEISYRLTMFSLIVGFLITFLSFIISGLITKPIIALTLVIQKMSRGRFDQRLKVSGKSELSQLAIAFNKMSGQLENLDKARNEFVSNASHELKTPLSSMKILIESLIHQEINDPVIYKEFLSDVNSEIDRLSDIINDLLTLVQLDNQNLIIKKQPVYMGDLVTKIVKNLIPIAKNRNIAIELIIQENTMVLGDQLKLQQVVSNLIDNAVKYTPDEGKVRVDFYRVGKEAILQVTDTGIGIPQEEIPHIFERFFRVDKARSRATGGTGLGLSIVHRIVLLHGGDIQVDTVEGKGSTFTIVLPVE